MASKFQQELPPPGGYAAYNWGRKAARVTNGYLFFGAFIGFTTLAWINRHFYLKKQGKINLEMRESRIAVSPLFQAEANRDFLKHLRHNRDEENILMKDVPGWVTGTLYGKTVMYNEQERFTWPHGEEYYMHCSPKDKYDRVNERLYH